MLGGLPHRPARRRRRAAGSEATAHSRPSDRRARRENRRAPRRPVARLDVRRVPLLHRRTRESLRPRAVHRLHARRRIRGVRRRRRALLLPDSGRLFVRGSGAAVVRGSHRLSRVSHDRRREADRLLRIRLGRADPRASGGGGRARGLPDHARRMGAVWAGGTSERPAELDAAIIFAPAGALVVTALAHVAKGGVVVCAGIHMSDIPSFPYSLLWGERVMRSVANLTRQDGIDFFARLQTLRIETQRTRYALEDANEALRALRSGEIVGTAVLEIG